jgi:uroporphyrinogen-III synthase
MAGLVIVTRPAAQSGSVAEALTRKGYEALTEPMLEIEYKSPALPDLARFGGLIFSSANAVAPLAERVDAHPLPAYAVGRATATALRSAGFRDVRCGENGAAALIKLVAANHFSPAPLLYLSGRVVAHELVGVLLSRGIQVERVVVYDALPATQLSAPVLEALYACTIDSVLFFSKRTATTFGTLVVNSGLELQLRTVSALCLSASVAEGVLASHWKQILVAEKPTMDSLLALLPSSRLSGTDG